MGVIKFMIIFCLITVYAKQNDAKTIKPTRIVPSRKTTTEQPVCSPKKCKGGSDWFGEPTCDCVPKGVMHDAKTYQSSILSLSSDFDEAMSSISNETLPLLDEVEQFLSAFASYPGVDEALAMITTFRASLQSSPLQSAPRLKRNIGADACASLQTQIELASEALQRVESGAAGIGFSSLFSALLAFLGPLLSLLGADELRAKLDAAAARWETARTTFLARVSEEMRTHGQQKILYNRWCDPTPIPANVIDAAKFFLFTNQNEIEPDLLQYNNIDSVKNSHFNPQLPTRILIHGFQGDINSYMSIKETYLQAQDLNVIILNWKEIADNILYPIPAAAVKHLGALVAKFFDGLIINNVLPNLSNVNCIGHSLGAQTCGFAGKRLTRDVFNTIIGLDPADPFFPLDDISKRLDSVDAQYVEVIHTDSNVFGMNAVMGHADWFPNGGVAQAGCVGMAIACDHGRAVEYFHESLTSDMLWAHRCEDTTKLEANECTGPGASMGGEPSNNAISLRGLYRMETNSVSPYGKGPY